MLLRTLFPKSRATNIAETVDNVEKEKSLRNSNVDLTAFGDYLDGTPLQLRSISVVSTPRINF